MAHGEAESDVCSGCLRYNLGKMCHGIFFSYELSCSVSLPDSFSSLKIHLISKYQQLIDLFYFCARLTESTLLQLMVRVQVILHIAVLAAHIEVLTLNDSSQIVAQHLILPF